MEIAQGYGMIGGDATLRDNSLVIFMLHISRQWEAINYFYNIEPLFKIQS